MPPEGAGAAERLVEPRREGDEHESGERRADTVRSCLPAHDPHQPRGRCIERKREKLLQPRHPGAGPRQEAAPRGHESQDEIGQGQPQPERFEDDQRDRPRLSERESDGGAHERRRARRSRDGGEGAGGERSAVA